MLVKITNKTQFGLSIDLDGNKDTADTVVIGPKGKETVKVPSEKRFLEISKEYKNKIIMRKV